MEDTLTQDNEAMIQEMLANAENAPEPGGENRIVHRGDGDQPAPMTVAQMESAGHVWIYDTKDGERSKANRNMLPTLLRITYPDGTRRFTTKPLPYHPPVGKQKCMLHPEHPNRGHYDEMGLPVCKKSNLRNKHMVNMHMRRRHPREWEAIEQERLEIEKTEDREAQRTLYQVVAGKVVQPTEEYGTVTHPISLETTEGVTVTSAEGEAPLYVSPNPPKAKKPKRRNKVR